MSLLDDIKLWLEDHGIDTSAEETQAYYELISDGVLLSELIDAIRERIASCWNGEETQTYDDDATLWTDTCDDVHLALPIFRHANHYSGGMDFEHSYYYENWECVNPIIEDYYNSARQFYALPHLQDTTGKTLPNKGSVLVIKRFIAPVIKQDVYDVNGVLCTEYETDSEYGLEFQWNPKLQQCQM